MAKKIQRSKHWLYRRWTSIIQATQNTNSPDYKWCGARGIENEFKTFEDFAQYIERYLGRPKPGFARLHRREQDGNYAPGNLEWTNGHGVVRSNSRAIQITYRGKTKPLAQWALELGINRHTMASRYHQGWLPAEILEFAPRAYKKLNDKVS
jgi:hypothetical protein